MIIAVRSFDFVDLLAETTIAPVVDTSAAAVSRVGSSAVLSRSHKWGMLTDMAGESQGVALFAVGLAPGLSRGAQRSTMVSWGAGATCIIFTQVTSDLVPTSTYRRLQRLQRLSINRPRCLTLVSVCFHAWSGELDSIRERER